MTAVLPAVSKISNTIWRVLGGNPSAWTLQGTNIYVIGRGSRKIVIEAGPGESPEFVKNLKLLLKSENAKIEHLILTHWHGDHVGGLKELVPVFQGLGEMPRVHKFRRLDAPDIPVPSEYPYEELVDGKTFTWDGLTLKSLYTPGHTTDHACLILEEENTLFCGDCLLGEGTGIFSDLSDYLNSLRKILNVNPDRILPGHGPVIEDAKDRVQYYIDHLLRREARVYEFLKDRSPLPASVSDIAQHMYWGLSAGLQAQARSGIILHLIKLEKDKKISKLHGQYFVPTETRHVVSLLMSIDSMLVQKSLWVEMNSKELPDFNSFQWRSLNGSWGSQEPPRQIRTVTNLPNSL